MIVYAFTDLHINDDLTDEEDEEEIATVAVEEHKSVILHLLSQLKLGMDLTRVVLPTFILERRSLLEMFADSMGHHHLFINITNQTSPYLRMLSALEWYLTSFHIGRKSSVAKKPYNPIIGETFHCSWKLTSLDENVDEIYTAEKSDLICYTAEQVSHHPPVTAFYAECRQRQICLNASIWTKSNFSGMSVGVNMIGEVSLFLGEHGEQYDFTLPAAYARSIISIPWIELGGKVNINCPSTGYLANIIFHTKPFYGGKVNQVTAEVKNETGAIISRVQGEWNNHFEFTYGNINLNHKSKIQFQGETKTIYVDELPVCKKRVRPLSKQEKMESRKLWCNVTHALREGDISAATEYKRDGARQHLQHQGVPDGRSPRTLVWRLVSLLHRLKGPQTSWTTRFLTAALLNTSPRPVVSPWNTVVLSTTILMGLRSVVSLLCSQFTARIAAVISAALISVVSCSLWTKPLLSSAQVAATDHGVASDAMSTGSSVGSLHVAVTRAVAYAGHLKLNASQLSSPLSAVSLSLMRWVCVSRRSTLRCAPGDMVRVESLVFMAKPRYVVVLLAVLEDLSVFMIPTWRHDGLESGTWKNPAFRLTFQSREFLGMQLMAAPAVLSENSAVCTYGVINDMSWMMRIPPFALGIANRGNASQMSLFFSISPVVVQS
uniref:Oxysterol-binding protein n=1 Tax=Timema poppense TaxID=170557 RepID=A0A7R9CH82_TIMPO|nr:unnamed protein product [Timema poppensis]